MLLPGKRSAATTLVARETFIPYRTSAAYSISLYYHILESNSLNSTVIQNV